MSQSRDSRHSGSAATEEGASLGRQGSPGKQTLSGQAADAPIGGPAVQRRPALALGLGGVTETASDRASASDELQSGMIAAMGLGVGDVPAAPVQKKGSADPWAESTEGFLSAMSVAPGAEAWRPSQGPAVQRRGGGAVQEDPGRVQAIAQQGVANANSELPHFDSIARSFGRYQVDDIRAQVGGEGAHAARSIGAEAYATGDRVAFASSPDLHTAAHEAAHVVQQRAGVSLKGGVGQSGDIYERHADAVADAVVAGRSAEGLLAPFAGGGDGSGAGAVQMRGGAGGFSLFGTDEDEDDATPAEPLFTGEGANKQINPDSTFAQELPLTTQRLNEWLPGAPKLAETLADALDLDDEFADAIEAALGGADADEKASSSFWDMVRRAGIHGVALAYFAELNKIQDKFKDPKVPIVVVEAGKEKGSDRYELGKKHWLTKGGYTELVKKIEEALAQRGPEMIEALQRIDEAHALDVARVLDDLLKGAESSNGLLKSAHDTWEQLPEMARGELVRLFQVLGLQEHLAPGKRLDLVINGLPKDGESSYKARPPAKVFEEAQDGMWLNKNEIDRMSDVLGRRSAAGFIDHEVEKRRTGHLRATVDQLDLTYDRMARVDSEDAALDEHCLVVDTNIASLLLADPGQLAADQSADGKARAETRQRIITRIEQEKFTSIRLANMNILELYQDGSDLLSDPKNPKGKGGLPPFLGLPLNVKRSSAPYSQLLMHMEKDRIGQNKGAADRSMMADLFFAKVQKGSKPFSFMTIDKACVKPLMRWAEIDPVKGKAAKNWTELLSNATGGERTDGSFETSLPESSGVSGSGTVRVIPMDFGSESPGQMDEAQQDGESDKDASKEASASGGADASAVVKKQGAHPLLDAPAGEKHTVRDYMRFISNLGYDVFIVGGAIRDLAQGKDANDIDLATPIPDLDLLEALRKDGDVGKEFTSHTPEIHLIQIGKGGNQLDIACGKSADQQDPKKMDLAADAQTRDFAMNTLYLGEDEQVRDPTGKGDHDAKAKRVTFATPLPKLADDLRARPRHLARLVKFAIRGYAIDEEALKIVRPIAAEIITSLEPRDKELFLNTFTAPTPRDIVEAMRKLGFPPEALDALLPDQVRGNYDDSGGPAVFSRDLDIDRLAEIEALGEAEWDRLAQPEEKKDSRNNRTYQRRMRALDSATNEKLVIDIDFTDHGIAGHRAPHHHIYRLVGDKWNKNAAGLSHTGQPGEPAMADGRYTGPKPWTWVPADKLGGNARAVAEQLDAQYPGRVTVDDEILTFDGQVRLHVSKVRELQASQQLTELMLMARNVQAPGTKPHDQDDAWIKLTRSPKRILSGERLRFASHLQQVPPFLERCKLQLEPAFEDQPLEAQLRLYDLAANFGKEEDERLQTAAEAVRRKGYASPEELVERFELYLSTGQADETQLGYANELSARTLKLGAATLDERRAAIVRGAKELGFRSTPAAAYHFAKHGSESQSAGPEQYLQAAREVIAADLDGRSTIEQTGTENHIFFSGYKKAVVRVMRDGNAHIATFFSERLEEAEEESAQSNEAEKDAAKPEPKQAQEQLSQGLQAILDGETTSGTRNQFQVEGARRACSAIAVLAIQHLVQDNAVPTQQDIDRLLRDGATVYRTLQGQQNAEVQLMRQLAAQLGAEGAGIDRLLDSLAGETYYNPADVAGQVQGIAYQQNETVHGGDVAGAVARAIEILQGVPASGNPAQRRGGVALVVGAYTVSITRRGDDWYYFDSHGDRLSARAFTMHFTGAQMAELSERAVAGLGGRMRKGQGPQHDISLSLYQ